MMVYGLKVPTMDNRYRSVVGSVERSASGNTILRIGRELPGNRGWEQTEHVVLTPDELGALVTELIAQQNG